MALSTYTELKSAIADWLNRDDLTSVIPTFISLAEVGMERVLRTRNMLVRATATLDTQYSTVPSDFLEIRTAKLLTSPVQPLTFQSKDVLDQLDAERGNGGGKPLDFTVAGNQIRVSPAPDGEYTIELDYYAKLEKLSDSVASNWILASHPDAYLYGALLQAAPYLQDDARAATWNSLFNAAVEAIKTADERSAMTGGAINVRTKSFGVR